MTLRKIRINNTGKDCAYMKNRTMIQFFEWYLEPNCTLWVEAYGKASALADLGVTDVWLPPAYKCASGIHDVGYGVYDMYDLGEFDQKGSIPTKYGTKDQYLSAVQKIQREGMRVLSDIVFNHRMGADQTEKVRAKVFEITDRNHQVDEREISAWTRFDFPGRNGKYSNFTWNHTHFDGCDWDAVKNEKKLYLFNNKKWDDQVDIEKGNYDYLMGADLDLDNPEVFNELVRWGKWYIDMTGCDGFRIDAVKHINFSKMLEWISTLKNYTGKDLFAVGEYWNHTLSALTYYLDKTAHSMHLFDVPLHYKLHSASTSHGNFDMSKIFEGTLVNERANRAVTIVDNHDTQPGQALQSWVSSWFKLHAYSLILLRKSGIPCVFYGDLYGIAHSNISPIGEKLETLMRVRSQLAYGEQVDYFIDSSVVGFTRLGDKDHIFSGVAVIMTDSYGGTIRMCMGEKFIGKTMVDCLGNSSDKITVGSDGCANFHIKDGSVSVYVDERYNSNGRFE